MENTLPVVVVLVLTFAAVVIYMIVRNRKDEQEFEKHLNEMQDNIHQKHIDEKNI
jgi:preprotein translocase subunit YajC